MDKYGNSKATPSKRTSLKNSTNSDYDYNSEYGDGDIPDIDKPRNNAEDSEDSEFMEYLKEFE